MDERDKKAREILRQEVGITDEDFEKWRQNPRNYFFLDNMPILRQYQLVAEVLSSRNCTAQLKPGQKLVFELMPAVLQKDSTAPACGRAVGAVAELGPDYWKAIASGKKPEEIEPRVIDCPDPGLDNGGFGHIKLKVYLAKKPG